MEVPKRERLEEFQRRLLQVPRAATFDEALAQLADILTAVEDELTDVPNNPENWRYDDRIYPPQPDNLHEVPDHPSVKRFRSVGHNTFVGANGALEIVAVGGEVELRKPCLDGRGVWELD